MVEAGGSAGIYPVAIIDRADGAGYVANVLYASFADENLIMVDFAITAQRDDHLIAA